MINAWVSVRTEQRDNINARLKHSGEGYEGPVDECTNGIFCRVCDHFVVQGLSLSPIIDGEQYHLYSLYFESVEQVIEALAYGEANQEGKYKLLHSPWDRDGLPLGMGWVTDDDGIRTGAIAGEPMFPTDPGLLEYMPDVIIGYNDEEPIYSTAIVPAQINERTWQRDASRIFLKPDGSVWI